MTISKKHGFLHVEAGQWGEASGRRSSPLALDSAANLAKALWTASLAVSRSAAAGSGDRRDPGNPFLPRAVRETAFQCRALPQHLVQSANDPVVYARC